MNNHFLSDYAAHIRRFNRFYTRQIGLVNGHYLESPFSLTEARVIYELANMPDPSASQIKNELGLDAGYLSRILAGFQKAGLVEKRVSQDDNRSMYLSLTEKGRMEFENLNKRSQAGIETMLSPLSPQDQKRMVNAMLTIESLLDPQSVDGTRSPYIIRQPEPGDMGWVVKRHSELYTEEYGWDEKFEGLVAEIVAGFVQNFDARYERCWIAERDGENVGCIFLVKLDDQTAKLRLLLVNPKARGMGLGAKLIDECIRFARRSGYKRMVLWTNSILHSALHLYKKAGFQKTGEEPQHSFGQDLVFETWEMDL